MKHVSAEFIGSKKLFQSPADITHVRSDWGELVITFISGGGGKSNREISLVRPIPPPKLGHRVHGALNQTSYVEVGKSVAPTLVRHLEIYGIAALAPTILDFA